MKTALDHTIDEFERFLAKAKPGRKWTRIPGEECSFCHKRAIYHIGADCYMCANCGRGFGSSGL